MVDKLIAAMRAIAERDPAKFRELAALISERRREVEKKSTK